MLKNKLYFTVVILIFILSGCNKPQAYDEYFIPYDIKAFDVWVYNNKADKEYYAGYVPTDYSSAQDRLSDAQLLAYDFAKSKKLKNWDYVCCTVTNQSSCVTKVR